MEEMNKPKRTIIGTRKMIVILTCIFCLTAIIIYYASKNKALGAAELAGMTMITALGGVHTFRQKLIKATPNT